MKIFGFDLWRVELLFGRIPYSFAHSLYGSGYYGLRYRSGLGGYIQPAPKTTPAYPFRIENVNSIERYAKPHDNSKKTQRFC
jgi:hypothetical protein